MRSSRQVQQQKRQPSATQSSSLVPPAPRVASTPTPTFSDLPALPKQSWSLERLAITREELEPAQRYAVQPSSTRRPPLSPEGVLQKDVGPAERTKNTTGLPDRIKSGIERLSGFSLDGVRVHYNSSAPAQVDALAYTQDNEIYVGPGQEEHLAHEAWHVVQQKQNRVAPTVQVQGMPVNNDEGLEREAERMGARAKHPVEDQMIQPGARSMYAEPVSPMATPTIQRVLRKPNKTPLSDFKYYEELYKSHKKAIDSLEKEEDRIVGSREEFLKLIQQKEIELGLTTEEVMNLDTDEEEENVREVGDKEEVENEEDRLPSQPLPRFLQGILNELDVSEDIKRLSAALGQQIEPEYYKAALFEGDPFQTEESDSRALQKRLLILYLTSKAGIASCYAAAARLLHLVGTRNDNAFVKSLRGGAVGGSFDLEDQQKLIKKLCSDLDKAASEESPIIFKLQLGGPRGKEGHGFTLTVQGNTIYQLEALAGREEDAEFMFSDIMKGGTKRTLKNVQQALRLIVSDKVQNRRKGARMLGWNPVGIALITKDEPAKIQDPMNIYWIASSVASEESIRERVAQQIQLTRKSILAIVSDETMGQRGRSKRQKLE